MTKQFAVIGNPIEQSRSPELHHAFAAKTGVNLDYKKIKGKVFLYRPSNKQLDFEVPISISKNYLLVPENRLVDGRWNIAVEWEYENKKYLTEEALNF